MNEEMKKIEKFLREWDKREIYLKKRFSYKTYLITIFLTLIAFSIINFIFSKFVDIYNPYIKWLICYPLLIVVTLIFYYKYLYGVVKR